MRTLDSIYAQKISRIDRAYQKLKPFKKIPEHYAAPVIMDFYGLPTKNSIFVTMIIAYT